MNVLLDTHAFLWFVTNDPQLSPSALAIISDPNHDVFLSPASYWEIAIKVSLGKYTLTVPFETFFEAGLQNNNIQTLAIDVRHAAVLASLGYPTNHRDPFDRMIVAQSIAEQIPLVSIDHNLDAYPIRRLW